MYSKEPQREKKRGLITLVIGVSLLLLAVIFVTGQYALYGQVCWLRCAVAVLDLRALYGAQMQMELREAPTRTKLARDAARPCAAYCAQARST
jgi:hypothetical protein